MPDPYQFWIDNQSKKKIDPYDFYVNNQGKVDPYDFYLSQQYGYPSLTDEEKSRSVSMTGRELLEEHESPGFMGALWSGMKAGATLGYAADEPVSPESMTFGESAAEVVGHLAGGLLPFGIASVLTGGATAPIAGAKYSKKVYNAYRRLSRYSKMTKNLSKSADDIAKKVDKLGWNLDDLPKSERIGLKGQYFRDYSKIKSKLDLTTKRQLIAESTIKDAQRKYIQQLTDKGAHKQARRLSKIVAKSPHGLAGTRPYGKILGNSNLYKKKIIEPLAKEYGYKGAAIADRFANSAITFASVGLVSNKPGQSLVDRARDIPKDAFMGMMFAAAGTPTLLGKGWGPKMEPAALYALGGYPDYLAGKPDPNMEMKDRLLHGLSLVAFHYAGHGLSNIGIKDKMFKGLLDMGFDEPVAFEMAYNTKFTDNTVSHARRWYQKQGSLYHNKKNPKEVISISEFKSEKKTKEAEEQGFIKYINIGSDRTGVFGGKSLKEARRKLNQKYKKVDFHNKKLIDDLPPEVRENSDAMMEGLKSDWVEIGGEKKWQLRSIGDESLLGRDIPQYRPEQKKEIDFYKSQREDLEKVAQKNRIFDPAKDVKAIIPEKSYNKGDLVEWIKDGKEMFVDKEGGFYPVKVEKADANYVYVNLKGSTVPESISRSIQMVDNKIPISEVKMIKPHGKRVPKYKLQLRYSNRADGKYAQTMKETSWDRPDALIFDSSKEAVEYAQQHWIGKWEANDTIKAKINFLNAKEKRISSTKEFQSFGRAKGMMDRAFTEKEFTELEKKEVLRTMFPESKGNADNMNETQVRRVMDLIKGDDSISFDVFDNRISLPPENFVSKITHSKYGRALKLAGSKVKETILGTGAVGEMLGGIGAEQSYRQKVQARYRNTFMGLTVNLHNQLKRDLKGTGVTFRMVNDNIQAFLDGTGTFEGMKNSKESKYFVKKLENMKLKDSKDNEINALDAIIDRYRKFYDEAAIAQISSDSYIRDTSTKTLKRVPFVKIYDKEGNRVKMVDIVKDFELHSEQASSILKWMKGESTSVVNENGKRVEVDTRKKITVREKIEDDSGFVKVKVKVVNNPKLSKHHYIKDYSRKQVTEEFFDFINMSGDAFDKAAAFMARNDSELRKLKFDEGFARAKQLIQEIRKVHNNKEIYGQQYTRIADLPAYIYVSRGKGNKGDIVAMDKNTAFKEDGTPYKVGEYIVDNNKNRLKIGKVIKVYETDYVTAVDKYSSGLAHSTSSYHAWGNGNGQINTTISRISDGLGRQTNDKYYEQWSRKIMEAQIYGEKQGMFSKFMQPITRWSAIAGLSSPLSGLKNLLLGNVQNVTVFTGRELFDAYLKRDSGLLNPTGGFRTKWKDAREYSEKIGATYQSSFDLHLTTTPMSGFLRRWLPNLGAMRTTEILNRTVAQSIGPFSAQIHIANMSMQKNPATRGVNRDNSRRILRDVFEFSPEQISNMIDRYRTERTNYIKEQKKINGDVNGKLFKFRLNDIERQQAAQQAHVITQGSGDLPYIPYWMGQGWAKPLTLFYKVAYRITDTVAKNVVKPAIVDGNMVPAMKYIGMSTLAGKTLYAAYDFIFDEERSNKFKDTPSQFWDYFLKAEGLALFSNASNEYGGWEEAYYPVPIKNVETVWDNFWDFIHGKKHGTTAVGDGMKGIVALYSTSERFIKKFTEKNVKKYDDSKRRQYQFLDAYYPKEPVSLDYEDGINAKTPYYIAIRDVFWHDDQSKIAQTYYTSLAFLSHRIMNEKGITNYLVAEKEARERLKRTLSSLQPIPKSWMKTIGRSGKTRYVEYLNALTPDERASEDDIMNIYREKQRNFYSAIARYRTNFYKKG